VMRAPGSAARNPTMRVETAGKIWPAGMADPRRRSKMSEAWAAADVDMRREMRAGADVRCETRAATADMRSEMWRAATTDMRRKMWTAATARMRTTAATWMAAGTVPSLGVTDARR
jgi:hypothetical protein